MSQENVLPQEAMEATHELICVTIKDALNAKAVPLTRVDFAQDLVRTFEKQKKWSPKQEWWARFIYAEALGILEYDPSKKKKSSVDVGNFDGVYALFKEAKKHLKYPKIVLQTEKNEPVILKMAGNKSKMPDVVNITDDQPFGENKWFGRVMPTGEWVQNTKIPEEELSEVGSILRKLSKNPIKTAKEYAVLTGNCCFCNTPLSDPHSTAVGFGPVCAKHFGLYDEWKNADPVFKDK